MEWHDAKNCPGSGDKKVVKMTHPIRQVTRSGQWPSSEISLGEALWCVVIDQLAMRSTILRGGVHLRVRTPFLYLENGWTDRDEIWYVVRHQLSWQFT